MKKIVVALTLALMLALAVVTAGIANPGGSNGSNNYNANAANSGPDWITCKIVSLGPGPGAASYIFVTGTSDSGTAINGRWYILNSTRKLEMLATAIYAQGTDKQVRIQVNTVQEMGTVTTIYVTK